MRNGSLRRSGMGIAATLCAVGMALTGCSAPEPREISVEESELLSVVPFRIFDMGFTSFELNVEDAGHHIYLSGRVDWRNHRGYANVTVKGQPTSHSLVTFTKEKLASVPVDDAQLPEPPAGDLIWNFRDLDPQSGSFDAALSFLLDLASDHPEDPLLIRQNGTRWVGSEQLGHVRTAVFTGPGADAKPSYRVKYWVDEKSLLHKLSATLPGSAHPVVIMLSGTELADIDLPPVTPNNDQASDPPKRGSGQ